MSKQLRRIYAVEGVNGDNRVYVDETSDWSIRILFENEIFYKFRNSFNRIINSFKSSRRGRKSKEKI